MRPLRGLQESRVATREESGVLGFPSRRGLTPRGSLECNPEIPAIPGDNGEGNGNPLQCSCLENPMNGGAWWAAVYGVTLQYRLGWFSLHPKPAPDSGLKSLNFNLSASQLLWFLPIFLFLCICLLFIFKVYIYSCGGVLGRTKIKCLCFIPHLNLEC